MSWVSLDGARIKAGLRDAGMSQGTLADKVALSLRQLERILAGGSETTPEVRDAIAECLALDPVAITLPGQADPPVALPAADAPAALSYRDFDPLHVRGRLPGTPDRFLGRDGLVEEVVSRVFRVFDAEPSQRTRNRLMLYGEGGNGKTTFLRALINNPRVVERFGCNRLWASLGPGREAREVLKEWCDACGVTWLPPGWQAEAARDMLTHHVGGCPVLFCIDDLWSEDQLIPLTVGGVRCAILATTRRKTLASHFAPDEGDRKYLGCLDEADAVALLRLFVGSRVVEEECRRIAHAVRGHPLALELAGHQLKGMLDCGQPVAGFLEQLRARTEEVMALPIPRDSAAFRDDILADPTLYGLFSMSTARVDDRTCYRLAVAGNALLPQPSSFDVEILAAAWGTDAGDAQQTINRLVGEGLLHVAREGRYQIHQLLALYAKVYMRRLEE
jgi:hypothetical protein